MYPRVEITSKPANSPKVRPQSGTNYQIQLTTPIDYNKFSVGRASAVGSPSTRRLQGQYCKFHSLDLKRGEESPAKCEQLPVRQILHIEMAPKASTPAKASVS